MNLCGLMYIWDITLNAISLVNLVMAVGISVDFCTHITRDFAFTTGANKVDRAKTSLINVGSTVSNAFYLNFEQSLRKNKILIECF